METKSVAVLTPTLGKISNLERSLTSVRNQDYKGTIRHYIIGDHLEKHLEEEVKRFCESKNAVFINCTLPVHTSYEPSRISIVRNFGVAHSSEDYIAHLDDDNSFDTNHISSLVELLNKNSECGIAHSWRRMLKADGTGCKLRRYPWVIHENEKRAKEVFELLERAGIFEKDSPIIKDRIIPNNDLNHIDSSEWMMRREVFEKVQFQEHFTAREMIYQNTEDYTFCRAAVEQGIQFICSEKVTLSYYLGGFHSGDTHILES